MFMRHPDSGPVTTVSQEAFDLVWKHKGWQEVSEEEARQAEAEQLYALTPGVVETAEVVHEDDPLPPGSDYQSMTIAELEAAAEDRDDVDLTGATRKDDIIARFTAADEALTNPAGPSLL